MASPFQPDYLAPERTTVDLQREIELAAGCSVEGVSVGRWANRKTWRVDFFVHTTPEQKAAALHALQAFKLQDDHSEDMSKPNVIA